MLCYNPSAQIGLPAGRQGSFFIMTTTIKDLETLFAAGVHFGSLRARRHPTAAPFVFGTKDRSDIFDLEETKRRLEAAAAYLQSVGAAGRQILMIGGKHEAAAIVKEMAAKTSSPYVAGRWIGGSLTNFKNIRKRIDRLQRLIQERETGELDKYTKKERLLIDREIEELLGRFGGLVTMTDLPAALVVVDTRHEETAVNEANQLKIPVVGIASSDCDFSRIQYPVPANEGTVASIRLLLSALADSYVDGKSAGVPVAEKKTRVKKG